MARRKIMMILSFLVLLIFISGFSCSVSNPLSKNTKTDSKAAKKAAEDIRTGTEGVSASFIPNNPPDTIYVEQSLPKEMDVVVELSNKGVYPQIEEGKSLSGKIFLSGYDKNILPFEPAFYDLSKKTLTGKSLVDLRGGSDIVTFNVKQINLDALKVEKYEASLMATVCYNYQTIAGPSVCIDPDPYSVVKQKKVCQAGPVTLTSQGAPIAIVSIDEEAFATKTQFKINIKNVGGGEVLRAKGTAAASTQPQVSGSNDDTIGKCDPFGPNKLTREDIDKVYLEEVSLGLTPLPCWPFTDKSTKSEQGLIRLINGEGSIICEFTKTSPEQGYPGGNTAYTAPMKIILSYGYKVTTERKVLIKKENIGKT